MNIKSIDFCNLLKSLSTYDKQGVIIFLRDFLIGDDIELSTDKRMFFELYESLLAKKLNPKYDARKKPCYQIYSPTTGLYVGSGFRLSKHGKAWFRKSDVKLLINSNLGKFTRPSRRDNSILKDYLIIDIVNNTEENAYDFWKSS